MGNFLTCVGCSVQGERILAACKEGDVEEVAKILDEVPSLAKYSTFGLRLSPLHYASARGHVEIVQLLLEHGASVNARNHAGQTPLMQACYFGHYKVVQTLMIHEADISINDYVMGRTAVHVASVRGQTECLRILLADFVPSSWKAGRRAEGEQDKQLQQDLFYTVNMTAECDLTPLHLSALHGNADTCHLLLDFGAIVNSKTGQDGMDFDLRGNGMTIGGRSLPLHYAACSGNLNTVQVLMARGGDKRYENNNGWKPSDIARLFKHRNLELILDPANETALSELPPSRFLALPLKSIIDLARAARARPAGSHAQQGDTCGVCFERKTEVRTEECGHELCVSCALDLCCAGSLRAANDEFPPGAIPCPFCRHSVLSFLASEGQAGGKEEAAERAGEGGQ